MMKTEALHIGLKVKHPQYGEGEVKAISEHAAEIRFKDALRTISPEGSDLQPAQSVATLTHLELPLTLLIEQTTQSVLKEMGYEKPDAVVEELGARWHNGRLVMHPGDPLLQTKEVPLEVLFHKIVMIRNNLRVLEQKINAHPQLSEGEKVDMQQYITRCYGSMGTFNLLFKSKEGQFTTA